ncbi:MAG: T9SS type A sorting domain-containing protein [Bacteroidota bacterium]|nr:T9SS type A sorting domain-containing protein [Bacteroidota bacterium]
MNINICINYFDNKMKPSQAIAYEPLGFASVKAQSILCFAYDMCESYYGHVSEPQPKSHHFQAQDPRKFLNDYYNKLTVSPNPVGDYAIFTWELPLFEGEATLRVADINGVIVQQVKINQKQGQWLWDTRNVKNGTYIYEIVFNGNQLASGKIVIQK